MPCRHVDLGDGSHAAERALNTPADKRHATK